MDNLIRSIIIEDEPVARDIIRQYSEHIPFLQIVDAFDNAIAAREFLSVNKIDLLFLDINMPVLNGIGLLKTLQPPPQIIFTTAYDEYALEAFELAACDYLLKPFPLERFMIAVDRAKKNLDKDPEDGGTVQKDAFFVKGDGRIYQIKYAHFLYAAAQENYTKIVTTDRTLLTKMPFSGFIALLSEGTFCRVHRSFIINPMHINYVQGNCVFIGEKEIPVSPNYKAFLLKRMGIE